MVGLQRQIGDRVPLSLRWRQLRQADNLSSVVIFVSPRVQLVLIKRVEHIRLRLHERLVDTTVDHHWLLRSREGTLPSLHVDLL